ncbi:GDSL-type esterase/lipase family protein [Novosphingobium aquae]|uniref:GDSL-type esterase/lipase family protein n=1 Tax=Novosphingobium aquae TaxID=3133435 RepID=UPI003A952489
MPPLTRNPFDEDQRPAAVIAEQNRWLRSLTQEKGLVLADYHAVLAGAHGGYKPGHTEDGLHPSAAGYAAMRPVFDKALAEAGSLTPAPRLPPGFRTWRWSCRERRSCRPPG